MIVSPENTGNKVISDDFPWFAAEVLNKKDYPGGGREYTLIAVVAEGWEFSHWLVTDSCKPDEVLISTDITLSPPLEPDTSTLTAQSVYIRTAADPIEIIEPEPITDDPIDPEPVEPEPVDPVDPDPEPVTPDPVEPGGEPNGHENNDKGCFLNTAEWPD